MNLDFRKTDLATAENKEGAVVRSVDRELMSYERGEYRLFVEVFFPNRKAVAYEPQVPHPLPAGMTEDEVRQEVRAGVACNAEMDVDWQAG